MGAVVETGFAATDELEVGLVHQRGGIEGLAVLAGELAPGHGMQLGVEAREHVVECATVPFAGCIQQQCDVGTIRHDHRSPGVGSNINPISA
jgi:hypothetical protein